MSTPHDVERRLRWANAYLAGERIAGVKFRHNSLVRFTDQHGDSSEGWTVTVRPSEPEPVYVVERADGAGDEEVSESLIELISDRDETL